MSRRILVSLVAATVMLSAGVTLAQTDNRMLLLPWKGPDWGVTTDRIIYQTEADVHKDPDSAQVFWWDSIGRFRLSRDLTDVTHFGYRYLSIDFDTNSKKLPETLDQLSAAVGVRLGEAWDGKISVIVG